MSEFDDYDLEEFDEYQEFDYVPETHYINVEQFKFICRVVFILDCEHDDYTSSAVEELMDELGLNVQTVLFNEQQIVAAIDRYTLACDPEHVKQVGEQKKYPLILDETTWEDVRLRIKTCLNKYRHLSDDYQIKFVNQLLQQIS